MPNRKPKLMKISEWATAYFEAGSRPTLKTVRKWIDEGSLPGERIGSAYYVDLNRWRQGSSNPLVDKVLSKVA